MKPRRIGFLLSLTLLCGSSFALGYYDTMRQFQTNQVSFVTGGFINAEHQLMKLIESNYNLHIQNSGTDRTRDGDTLITISDRWGREVVTTQADSLLYAELPSGFYNIKAVNKSGTQLKPLTLAHQETSRVHFIWR